MEESLEKFCNKIKLGHIECWKLSEFYPAGEQLGLDWFTAQPLFSPDWVDQPRVSVWVQSAYEMTAINWNFAFPTNIKHMAKIEFSSLYWKIEIIKA